MKSFLQGKKTLTVTPLRGTSASAPGPSEMKAPVATPHAAHKSATGTPHVEVIKEGDKVVRLIVTCTCGERIEIECLYPGGA